MVRRKKRISLLLLAALLIALVQGAQAAETPQGREGSVSFGVSGVTELEGSVKVSDPDGILSDYNVAVSGTLPGGGSGEGMSFAGDEPGSVSVKVSYTVARDAAVGATAQIDWNYCFTDAEGVSVCAVQTETVTATELYVPRSDVTALEEAIAEAEALSEETYTVESWELFSKALSDAKRLNVYYSQAKVDEGLEKLRYAMEALQPVDRKALISVLAEGRAYYESEELGAAWTTLLADLEACEALAGSRDQEAINAAAEKLEEDLALLHSLMRKAETAPAEATQPPAEPASEEISDEPAPLSAFSPRVGSDAKSSTLSLRSLALPLLLALSVLANVGLFVYLRRRNKLMETDTTPIVDYSIDDDDF